MIDTSVTEDEIEHGPSRSKQRVVRQDTQARLEALGARLTQLSDRQLLSLELGSETEHAVRVLATLTQGSSLSRQRRRVAGLLREYDLDVLEQRVTDTAAGISEQRANRLERARRALMSDDAEAIAQLYAQHPDVDRQHLNQAVRAAQREAEAGPPGRHFKSLFQVLKELGIGKGD